jgi:hypothetical protein
LNDKIKLIWDFRGLDSIKIAEHHSKHIQEFATKQSLNFYKIDCSQISDIYSIAFIIIDKKDLTTFKDALKPHRAEVAK